MDLSSSLSKEECVRCKACDHPRPAYAGGYASLRSTLSSMIARARDGCVPCLVLSNGITQFLENEDNLGIENVDELQINFNLSGSRRSLEIFLLGTDINLSFFCSASSYPSIKETFPDIPVGMELPDATSSPSSLSWASSQLERCKSNHSKCKRYASPSPYLPTRVLDLANDDSIRLHEPRSVVDDAGAAAPPPYIALSHCWGQTPFVRTLSTNISTFKSGIPVSSLPPTFRDAVRFTRSLSIRYLWIDSLCIVQDDPLDWQREASEMASVYRNATLVLSASSSDSAYGGLFRTFPASHASHLVSAPLSTFEGSSIFVRRALVHATAAAGISSYHSSSVDEKGTTATALPAFKRGWIMQERLLSGRVLHFNAQELAWECLEEGGEGEGIACQCRPSLSQSVHDWESVNTEKKKKEEDDDDDDEKQKGRGGVQQQQPRWFKNMVARSSSPKAYYAVHTWEGMTRGEKIKSWHDLVEDYTKLQLSFEKDVFPALGGMARVFYGATAAEGGEQPPAPGKYLAGLWEDGLDVNLLWHCATKIGDEKNGAARRRRRPQKWRAPSWSWAGVLGAVEYLNVAEGFEKGYEVLSARTESSGLDPMGELAGGELVIEGSVVFCKMGVVEDARIWDAVRLDVLEGRYLKNLWVDDLDECKRLTENQQHGEVALVLVGKKLPRRELLFLMLVEVKDSQASSEKEEKKTYQRIGLLEVFGGPPAWADNLLTKGENGKITII